MGGIPTHLPLWVMVDIYGNTTSIRFVGEFPIHSKYGWMGPLHMCDLGAKLL